jgi:hypothetical protein
VAADGTTGLVDMIFEMDCGIDLDCGYVEFTIEYDASEFIPQTYDHPAEGGEIEEIRKVTVTFIEGYETSGESIYMKTREQLGDWAKDLDKVILEEIQNDHGWEADMLDYANDCMEDWG